MEKTHRNIRKKHLHRSSDDGVGFAEVIRGAFIGTGAAIVSMLLMAVISSGLCMLSPDPAALTLPVGIVIFFISSAIGGVISAQGLSRDRTAALFSGLACGFCIMIFLGVGALVQNVLASDSAHNVGRLTAFLIRGSSVPLSAAFACFAAKSPKRRKRGR